MVLDLKRIRDFKRNIQGRFQLFQILMKMDRIYRREVLVTILAFILVNYSIIDMDSRFDIAALAIECFIIWIQLGNEFSILPKDYRPNTNGISFGAEVRTTITHDGKVRGFDEIQAPKSEHDLKMYNPLLAKNIHKETPLCSDVLNDHIMSTEKIPFKIDQRSNDYIASVHQIRYLAIRIANKKQHTTNGVKVTLNDTARALMTKEPASLAQTTYFESLLTTEAFRSMIKSKNLHGNPEISTDLTQYYPVDEVDEDGAKSLHLSDDYYKRVAIYIGATSLVFTENRRILMMFQGSGKAMEANKIMLGGSGSVDMVDASNNTDGDLRSIARLGMAREVAEETNHKDRLDEILDNTLLTGFFHWMDRAGKPEFSGITKAGIVPFASLDVADDDEIVKTEEIPITVNDLADFHKIWAFVVDNKLNVSLSSLMALHRMTVIADYNKRGSSDTQKQIYEETKSFLFS